MKKNGVSIIDSIPHCHTENALKKGQKQEMWLRFYIVETMEYLSSIVFHTVILIMLSNEAKSRNVASLLYSGTTEYVSSIVFHTVILNKLSKEA